jgi:hypothetical protein
VMAKLLEGGVEVTAVHNHLLRAEPLTFYMHIGGSHQRRHTGRPPPCGERMGWGWFGVTPRCHTHHSPIPSPQGEGRRSRQRRTVSSAPMSTSRPGRAQKWFNVTRKA